MSTNGIIIRPIEHIDGANFQYMPHNTDTVCDNCWTPTPAAINTPGQKRCPPNSPTSLYRQNPNPPKGTLVECQKYNKGAIPRSQTSCPSCPAPTYSCGCQNWDTSVFYDPDPHQGYRAFYPGNIGNDMIKDKNDESFYVFTHVSYSLQAPWERDISPRLCNPDPYSRDMTPTSCAPKAPQGVKPAKAIESNVPNVYKFTKKKDSYEIKDKWVLKGNIVNKFFMGSDLYVVVQQTQLPPQGVLLPDGTIKSNSSHGYKGPPIGITKNIDLYKIDTTTGKSSIVDTFQIAVNPDPSPCSAEGTDQCPCSLDQLYPPTPQDGYQDYGGVCVAVKQIQWIPSENGTYICIIMPYVGISLSNNGSNVTTDSKTKYVYTWTPKDSKASSKLTQINNTLNLFQDQYDIQQWNNNFIITTTSEIYTLNQDGITPMELGQKTTDNISLVTMVIDNYLFYITYDNKPDSLEIKFYLNIYDLNNNMPVKEPIPLDLGIPIYGGSGEDGQTGFGCGPISTSKHWADSNSGESWDVAKITSMKQFDYGKQSLIVISGSYGGINTLLFDSNTYDTSPTKQTIYPIPVNFYNAATVGDNMGQTPAPVFQVVGDTLFILAFHQGDDTDGQGGYTIFKLHKQFLTRPPVTYAPTSLEYCYKKDATNPWAPLSPFTHWDGRTQPCPPCYPAWQCPSPISNKNPSPFYSGNSWRPAFACLQPDNFVTFDIKNDTGSIFKKSVTGLANHADAQSWGSDPGPGFLKTPSAQIGGGVLTDSQNCWGSGGEQGPPYGGTVGDIQMPDDAQCGLIHNPADVTYDDMFSIAGDNQYLYFTSNCYGTKCLQSLVDDGDPYMESVYKYDIASDTIVANLRVPATVVEPGFENGVCSLGWDYGADIVKKIVIGTDIVYLYQNGFIFIMNLGNSKNYGAWSNLGGQRLPNPPQPPGSSTSSKKKLTKGQIAGIVIGSVCGFALIVGFIIYFIRKRRRQAIMKFDF